MNPMMQIICADALALAALCAAVYFARKLWRYYKGD